MLTAGKIPIFLKIAINVLYCALQGLLRSSKKMKRRENMTEEVITDVVCSFCGCLCDDIEIVVKDGKIIDTRNSCKISHTKFIHSADGEDRIKEPLVRKDGELKTASLEEAIERVANILKNSKYPLCYGWASTSCEAQEVGTAIAEEIGGIIDNTSTVCHGPTDIAEQSVGCSSCTLGEIKNRSNLIIYWGSNPLISHARHLSRYTLYPRGFFRPSGSRSRELIVIDTRKTDTAKIADTFIQVKPNEDYELISAIRTLLNGGEIQKNIAGVNSEEIKKLTEKMKNCGFGVLFFGLGLTMSKGKYRNVDNALSLVTDLNRYTKFVIMPMRGHYNVTGADTVLTWETGFPYAVDFSRGYPRYSPGEYSAVDVLANCVVDSALIVASDPVSHMPKKASEHLQKIPVVTIDPYKTPTTEISDVVIPAAIMGIEASGTAYRMDKVPIRLRKVVDPPEGILPDEEILRRILDKIKGGL